MFSSSKIPPNFERRRRENQGNNYSDNRNYYTERGGNSYNVAKNVLADIVKTQEQPNQVSRIGYYNKSMEIIHEQYNQI